MIDEVEGDVLAREQLAELRVHRGLPSSAAGGRSGGTTLARYPSQSRCARVVQTRASVAAAGIRSGPSGRRQ